MLTRLCRSSTVFARSARSMQSYVNGASTDALRFETIGECFRRAVEKKPDKEFIIFREQGVRKTFSQVYDDARRMAAGLFALGLNRGDRVAFWGHSYYESTVIQFATAMAGMVQVSITPDYQSAELHYALKKVQVAALIIPKQNQMNNFMRALIEICPVVANGKPGMGTVNSRDLPDLKHVIVFGEKEPVRGAWDFNDIMDGAGSRSRKVLEEVETTVLPDDPMNIQYTSGTTGYPKAATLTHHSLLNNARFVGARAGWDTKNHIVCVPNPLHQIIAPVLGVLNAMQYTQTCVFPFICYDVEKVMRAIEEEKCTFVFGTPTMFIDMLSSPNFKQTNLSSLTGGVIGAAPCPRTLCEAMVKHMNMSDIYIVYGATELTGPVTLSIPTDPPIERTSNVGHVLPATEIAIVDKNGRVVPRGQRGELLARGYVTMRGYWNDEEKTGSALTADRWYHTGDTASMNESGSINIVGRTVDMICRAGVNVYPTEVEGFLTTLDYVADAQVVGVPDFRLGEAVCAWIRLKDRYKDKITPQMIIDACKGKIAHIKVPEYVLIKEEHEFPLNAAGKVKKFELRNISKQLLGLETVKSHYNEV